MNKIFIFALAAATLFSACQREEFAEPIYDGDFYASVEEIASTKTQMDESRRVLWSDDDRIVIFNKADQGIQYKVRSGGKTTASFTKVESDDFMSPSPLAHVVAYYPYSDMIECVKATNGYSINVVLPSEQIYAENSFGNGALPMAAISENANLAFKNVNGAMRLQLKGTIKVASLKVEGKDNEKLSGAATVTVYTDGSKPTIELESDASAYVTLDCGDGVQLSMDEATDFIISIPPVKFTKGFTVTITDAIGVVYTVESNKSTNEISRSSILKMPEMTLGLSHREPMEGDYIGEYGVNHGQGVEIDGIVWAPVNCGFHESDYPWGKLYQWGRKYGQGYNTSYDASARIPVEGPVSLQIGQSKDNEDYFYMNTRTNESGWLVKNESELWNLNYEGSPIKSEYDPCPDGWRVPTAIEVCNLIANKSAWTSENAQNGYWFSGSQTYSSSVSRIFLPATGSIHGSNAGAYERDAQGNYWASNYGGSPIRLRFTSSEVTTPLYYPEYGFSVRCVKYDGELIPVSSLILDEASLSLQEEETFTLPTTISPSNANHQSAFWWSEDESVAKVDRKGVITAVSAGTTTITAMAGMQIATCTVTVTGSEPDDPSADNAIDLAVDGLYANSYIVSSSGDYKFQPVKGNSYESVGIVASVEVLWESFGTDETPVEGDLISAAVYDDYYIVFSTAEDFREGNAVIAAKDASGTILWSWHIWLTDEPEEQVYYNGAGTMMDRNLGATSSTPGDVGALGLLYQWGRKDPFLGSSTISSDIDAKSTGSWPSTVSSSSSNGTIEYAVKNPMTYITANSSSEYDWHYSSRNNKLWQSEKTIYDPCPAGWRVPDGGSKDVWSKALGFSLSYYETYDSNEGINFSGKFGSSSSIWYPASGCRGYDYGLLCSVGYSGSCWSCTPFGSIAYYLYFNLNGDVYPSCSSYRASGRSVRCLKEGSSTETPKEYENLSAEGTANSYMVSQEGDYKFEAVKGNSNTSVGSVSEVEVLWESFGTDVTPSVGDLVKEVSYSDGYILFSTAEDFREGNAVIAARNSSGTILWSWHIWLTDQPEGQIYYYGAGTMMDRNLGATSATPGDAGALGLQYQWGRKDPFLGSSDISSSTVAKSTGSWPSTVSSSSSRGTIEYAVENPMTFITMNSSNEDWYYTGSSSTDNTRWESEKTIYDPCPAGWRVPDGGSKGVWSKALGSSSSYTVNYDSSREGINFSGKFGSASLIWYPASGYRSSYGGSLYDVGSCGEYWSVTPNSNYAYYLGFSHDGYSPSNYYRRAYGQSVRCLQE